MLLPERMAGYGNLVELAGRFGRRCDFHPFFISQPEESTYWFLSFILMTQHHSGIPQYFHQSIVYTLILARRKIIRTRPGHCCPANSNRKAASIRSPICLTICAKQSIQLRGLPEHRPNTHHYVGLLLQFRRPQVAGSEKCG